MNVLEKNSRTEKKKFRKNSRTEKIIEKNFLISWRASIAQWR